MLGGTSGDTKILAIDIDNSTQYILYGGSTEDSAFGGSVGSPKPLFGQYTYGGLAKLVKTINKAGATAVTSVAATTASSRLFFALDTTPVIVGCIYNS